MKIALVAMSGIRAWDAELLELGLTTPGVMERSQVIASLPSLGLLTLAGCTPTGHELSSHEIKDLDPDLSGIAADLVAISTFTAQIPEAYAVADQLRALMTYNKSTLARIVPALNQGRLAMARVALLRP